MNNSVARCNMCPKEKPFEVPWSGTTQADEVSAVLMAAHLFEAHGIEVGR